jgi:hypothetical protein
MEQSMDEQRVQVELTAKDLLDMIRTEVEKLLISDEISEEEKLARIQAAQEFLDNFGGENV